MIPAIVLLAVAGLDTATAQQAPASAPAPSLALVAQSVDFGETYQFATVEGRFQLTNRGARPVTLLAEPLLRTATAVVQPQVVAPGGSGTVTVRVPVADRLGSTGFRVRLTTDDPGMPEAKLTLTGFVQSAYEPESGLVDFGFVERQQGGERLFELVSREIPALSVLAIEGAPDWLEARAVASTEPGQTAALSLAIKPGAPLGRTFGILRVRTDLTVQPEYWLRYVVSVFDAVVPGENPVDLGLVRVGESTSKTVTLTSRDGRPITVERVTDAPPGLAVSDGPCPPPASTAPCRILTFVASPVTAGPLQGRVLVHLSNQAEPLPLDFAATVAGRNARVTDLGDLSPRQAPATPAPAPASAPGPAPAAMPAAVQPGATAPVAANVIPEARIVWEAGKESMAFGYLVYRAAFRQGPFVRVNAAVIRVPADGDERHTYRFVDTDVRPGATFFYYIDAVGLGGAKQRFSPVVSKTIAPAPATTPSH